MVRILFEHLKGFFGRVEQETGDRQTMEKSIKVKEIARLLEAAGLMVMQPFGPYQGWTELIIWGNFERDRRTGKQIGGERGIIGYMNNQWYF